MKSVYPLYEVGISIIIIFPILQTGNCGTEKLRKLPKVSTKVRWSLGLNPGDLAMGSLCTNQHRPLGVGPGHYESFWPIWIMGHPASCCGLRGLQAHFSLARLLPMG